ncbi:unnamed protein product [Rhizoctonia solani]|uniref:Uncharacterized protein n=1 Tax=Rhizoctonia solani TaxID=456999 RepID=A0A8H3H3S9_9AGAM|nr:unnamed protein product [Rhizoctonia solani]CAE6482394.1 unnamed protein product [Rhizoctonia solani]
MLRRWDRIQHAILESFNTRGTKPAPIWNLHELEPDDEQRAYLQRKIFRLGASEHDFLRWRNACVAFNLTESLNALGTLDDFNTAPMATPLWVTSHLLRRKVYKASQAAIAAHLALVAVPSSGLASAHEQPLLLALKAVTRYNSIHVLPALTSRILALPTKHHTKLLATLCKRNLPPSPLAAASLQMVLEDIKTRSMLLPYETWQSVWEKWVILNPLGDEFAASLRLQIKDQGFQVPIYRNLARSRSYTQAATQFPQRTTPSRRDPTISTLTAAAHSKHVSARFLLGIASTLADGFFSPHPIRHGKPPSAPSVTFLTALMLGLIRKRAYSRAVGVWKNAQNSTQKIAITPALLEAAVTAHILNGDLEEAVRLLDTCGRSLPNPASPVNSEEIATRLPSKLLTLLISHLPVPGQHLAFRQAYKRWNIQPDSSALEAVMVGTAEFIVKQSREELDIRSNMRELKEGFKNLFRRTPVQIEPPEHEPERSIFSPGPFDKRDAIRLFRTVLRNWPFIQGVEQGYWIGLLEKQAIELFIPSPLVVGRRVLDEDATPRPAFEFAPSPLHPSPMPSYPHACPTPRAWTAYLSLLDPSDLPQALGWMRSVDEFLRTRSSTTPSPLDLFRPERTALIDVLMRWEDAALAGETPIGRAWEERRGEAIGGVGREGALRAWLIEWLGNECVPNQYEVARARFKLED